MEMPQQMQRRQALNPEVRFSILAVPQRAARQAGPRLVWCGQACACRTPQAALPVQNSEERSSSTDLH